MKSGCKVCKEQKRAAPQCCMCTQNNVRTEIYYIHTDNNVRTIYLHIDSKYTYLHSIATTYLLHTYLKKNVGFILPT